HYKLGRERIEYFPTDHTILEKCKPVYETIEGWNSPLTCNGKPHLPRKAVRYIRFLEKHIDCTVKLVSLGPERHSIIEI
ncbi:MAG: adenylosuccinate synthetase, partial [Candidatus Latescibacterota bacterium]